MQPKIFISVLVTVSSIFAVGLALADKSETPKEVVVVNEDTQPIPVAIQGTLSVDVQTQSSVDINSLPDVIIDDSVPLNVNVTEMPVGEIREIVTLSPSYGNCLFANWPNDSQITWVRGGGHWCGFGRVFPDGTVSPPDEAWLLPPDKMLVITDVTFRIYQGFVTDKPSDELFAWVIYEHPLYGKDQRLVFSAIGHNTWPGVTSSFSGELHFETGFQVQPSMTLVFYPDHGESVLPTIQGYLIDIP